MRKPHERLAVHLFRRMLPGEPTPIVGASRHEQLAASLAAAEVKPPPEFEVRLDALSAEFRRGDAVR